MTVEIRTARANLLEKPQGNFVIGEYPIPDPAPGSLLMKVELCGVCGTDVHTWRATAEEVGCEYPISLGHEIAGTVAALGKGITTDYIGRPLKEGDRIGICPAIHCHKCYFCVISKTPEKFGTGIPEGVIAAEATDNACEGGSLIPTFALPYLSISDA